MKCSGGIETVTIASSLTPRGQSISACILFDDTDAALTKELRLTGQGSRLFETMISDTEYIHTGTKTVRRTVLDVHR